MSADRAGTLYRLAFGHAPTVVVSAPGRVNLIGEHTDYNGGEVLPIAISQRTWVAMGTATGTKSRAVSNERGDVGEWDAGASRASGKWWDYVAGALLESTTLGARARARDVAVLSDIPLGAGLSSSAALEVASVAAALALDGVASTTRDVALAAHRAETEYVGVSCGIMDQSASAMCVAGQALHVRCDTGKSHLIPFPRSVLIVDTATPRELRDSAYATRRAECVAALSALRELDPALEHLARASVELVERAALSPPLDARARHVVSETNRVRQCLAALKTGAPIGPLLIGSHESLRRDFACSSPELDWVVEFAGTRAGVEGARLTGAGWGGCAIAVGDDDALHALAPELSRAFALRWTRIPRVWCTKAEGGVRGE